MNVPAMTRCVAALLTMTLLAACSEREHAPAAAAPVSYAAVARGRIDIEGGLLPLAMRRDGILASVAVHEGDHVTAGQTLARLDDTAARIALASAQAERDQAQAQAATLEKRVAAAKLRAQRLASAAAGGATDGQSADDAAEALSQATAEAESARAQASLLGQKVASAQYDLAMQTLQAPVAGVVTQLNNRAGAAAGPASPLLVLLPDGPRIVRAELSEAYVNDVTVGMKAQVTIDSDAGAKPLQATVVRVGSVVGAGTLEDDAQARATSRSVDCVLSIESPQELRIGQRVLVRFAKAGP
ncbi:multidrug resistance efflux pump [Luteibacter sp. Sphag1AF]|uniref:efflux RND transporter periplasmic adaptor subunit n=1 Tax=Luteibacter sp. Sphag1AF TaxID=2587031 RepID=UPI0017BDB7CE|nr:HlyD family efflux transporter periplasmic adaptor subunit [Luteibacter sp. Sphag1AF]MBB3225688.1 multidrug resistance efflux pump [Luteibacter sp. Sphag1AF]